MAFFQKNSPHGFRYISLFFNRVLLKLFLSIKNATPILAINRDILIFVANVAFFNKPYICVSFIPS